MTKNVLNQLKDGDLSSPEKYYGFFDWFCTEAGLRNRSKSLVAKLNAVLKANGDAGNKRFNPEQVNVCFKNNCPMDGKLYDDFRICELDGTDVLFCVTPKSGFTSDHGASSLWARDGDEMVEVEGIKVWDDVLVYFGKQPKVVKPAAVVIEPVAAPAAYVPPAAPVAPVPQTDGTRYPKIQVQLVGTDGNAFSIMGAVAKALRRAYVPKAEIDAFYAEATSGDYDNLLGTAMKWVDVS